MRRKEVLAVEEIYHVFNKSIAGFKIFNSKGEFLRFKDMFRYYQIKDMPYKFSGFLKLEKVKKEGFDLSFLSASEGKEKLVQIIAYCIMPTHVHLILKQLTEGGISTFTGNILNSYSHYFNIKHKRKGPLWEGRFKNVLVENDEQLLHLSRYIHLNPVAAYLVDDPADWEMSSYKEYLSEIDGRRVCEYGGILDIKPAIYKKFVKERIPDQRELAKIDKLLID